MKRLIYLLFLLMFPAVLMNAQDLKTQADTAYVQERYAQAAELYEQLLEQGHSSDVYYNLGNCYYRLEKVGHAVLNYERALRLDPGDRNIRHNLELARNKTQDKVVALQDIFIVTWYKGILYSMSVDGWGFLATVCFVLFLCMMGVYLFLNRMALRKIGFFAGIAALVICILANVFAYHEKVLMLRHDTAVLMQESVHVKSTPSQDGKDLFVIHEGTKMHVVDDAMRDWKEIRLDDGKTGWVETSAIEVI